MLASPLPPSFLGTYSLSTSSLGCNALCMVISFLVLWSIFRILLWSTSRIVQSILRGGQSRYLSLLLGSCYIVLFRVTFWFSWDTLFFSSSPLIWWRQLPIFSERFDFFLIWFLLDSIPSVMRRFPLFTTSMVHFSMPNSILISWLYILTDSIRVSNTFSFLANSLTLSLYIKWFGLFLGFTEFVSGCDWVASSLLETVMVIVNLSGICLSGSFAKLFLPAFNSSLQVSMVFSINFITSSSILYILRQCDIQLWGPYYYYYSNNNTDTINFIPLAKWLECSPMARETRVQSQVESY